MTSGSTTRSDRHRHGHQRQATRRFLGAAWLISYVFLVAGCGGSGGDTKSSTTSTTVDATSTTATQGPPEGAELVAMNELDSDSCFDLQSDSKSMSRAAWLINCSEPHDFEMFAELTFQGDVTGRGATYPGMAVVQDQAEQRCYDEFEAFVGVRWSISELDIRTWWPSQVSWDNHDRKLLCAVTPTGRDKLTGTQRGSRR